MADTDFTPNVIELKPPPLLKDRTGAERQRRYRAKKRKRTRAVTPRAVTPVTPRTVTVAAPAPAPVAAANPPVAAANPPYAPTSMLSTITLLAALALATCSAAFSISGLTSIFAGAFWPVIGLGVAFEVGKLSAVAWLGHRHGTAPLRLALVALVAVLMVLNSIGVYGFLSRARIEHSLAGELAVASRTADVDARLEAKQADLADIRSRISLVDQTKTVAIVKRGIKTTTVGDNGPARAKLTADMQAAESAIAGLRIEKARVDGERKAVEADTGPVKYLAALLGSTDEQAMRAFILIVALLLDPGAVLLLLAATRR
jgi:hypothetical protein